MKKEKQTKKATVHPNVHMLVMGKTGSGKSTFASTFIGNQLVIGFDSQDKMTPYLRGHKWNELVDQDLDISCIEVDRGNGMYTIIELYHNIDISYPDAYHKFRRRLNGLTPFIGENNIQTVILDSVTFMELSARKYSEFILNKGRKSKEHWMYTTDQLEEVLMVHLPSLPCNVVVLCHVDSDVDDAQGLRVHNARAPGRLREGLPSAFGEFYYAFVFREGNTNRERAEAEPEYLLQTRADDQNNATSQINAPDPCRQSYEALWENWAS